MDPRFPVPLRGTGVDPHTRCTHYHTSRDVIALRCGCCETYYPCHLCHEETAGAPFAPWPRERFEEPAVLCGVCLHTLSARAYTTSPDACAHCGTAFNPGCRAHHALYFGLAEASGEER